MTEIVAVLLWILIGFISFTYINLVDHYNGAKPCERPCDEIFMLLFFAILFGPMIVAVAVYVAYDSTKGNSK